MRNRGFFSAILMFSVVCCAATLMFEYTRFYVENQIPVYQILAFKGIAHSMAITGLTITVIFRKHLDLTDFIGRTSWRRITFLTLVSLSKIVATIILVGTAVMYIFEAPANFTTWPESLVYITFLVTGLWVTYSVIQKAR